MNGKEKFDVVGVPRRRVDGRAKVTGQTLFADDLTLPRMLHCKMLRSPLPHARIRSVEYTSATKLFNVESVPVDEIISPEQLVTEYIEQLIHYPGALQVLNFADGRVRLAGVVAHRGGLLVGQELRQLRRHIPHTDARVAAGQHAHNPRVHVPNRTPNRHARRRPLDHLLAAHLRPTEAGVVGDQIDGPVGLLEVEDGRVRRLNCCFNGYIALGQIKFLKVLDFTIDLAHERTDHCASIRSTR